MNNLDQNETEALQEGSFQELSREMREAGQAFQSRVDQLVSELNEQNKTLQTEGVALNAEIGKIEDETISEVEKGLSDLTE